MNGKLFPAVLGAAAMLLVGSVAGAAIPDANGVIRDCATADTAGFCQKKKPVGLSGYQIISSDPVTLAPGASGEARVTCPDGTRAIGGGYIVGPTVHVTSLIPAGGGALWSAAGRNESDTNADSIRARAICADVVP
jgi:hypothetical protein